MVTRGPIRDQKLGVDYTRYSTADQGSTAEQQAINQEVAAEEGITLIRSFSDEGVSRSLSDRPGLRELFDYLESHQEVGYVVINELERMTAGINQRQEITAICKRLRITLVTEDMGRIDPHDEDKMHEADQRAVTAKGEVLKVRRRTRRNLRQKVRSKSIVSLRPPYGVRMKPLVMPDGTELPSGVSMLDASGKKVTSGEIERHPDEYPWLIKIFEWAAGGASLQEICRRLMAEGVPTKTGKLRWDSTTIRGILNNPLYKGEMTWGRRQTLRDENGRVYQEFRAEDDPGRLTFPSPLGPLVDVDTWERVQQSKAWERGTRMTERRENDPQVLDHRVFCGRCGHKMYGRADPVKDGGFSWRYLCLSSYGSTSRSGAVAGFDQPCTTGHSISLNDLLAGLAGEAGYGRKPITVTVVQDGLGDITDRRKRLKNEITAAQQEDENAIRLAIKGLLTDDQLATVKGEVAERIATAKSRLAVLDAAGQQVEEPFEGEYRAQVTELAERIADTSVPFEVRRELLDSSGLDRIYVNKPRLRLHFRE